MEDNINYNKVNKSFKEFNSDDHMENFNLSKNFNRSSINNLDYSPPIINDSQLIMKNVEFQDNKNKYNSDNGENDEDDINVVVQRSTTFNKTSNPIIYDDIIINKNHIIDILKKQDKDDKSKNKNGLKQSYTLNFNKILSNNNNKSRNNDSNNDSKNINSLANLNTYRGNANNFLSLRFNSIKDKKANRNISNTNKEQVNANEKNTKKENYDIDNSKTTEEKYEDNSEINETNFSNNTFFKLLIPYNSESNQFQLDISDSIIEKISNYPIVNYLNTKLHYFNNENKCFQVYNKENTTYYNFYTRSFLIKTIQVLLIILLHLTLLYLSLCLLYLLFFNFFIIYLSIEINIKANYIIRKFITNWNFTNNFDKINDILDKENKCEFCLEWNLEWKLGESGYWLEFNRLGYENDDSNTN